MSNIFSRHQTIKLILTFIVGLTTTLLASFWMTKESSMAQAIVVKQPNEFELQSEHTQITYSLRGNVPQLNYKSQNISRSFSGEEINTLITELGTIITVILSTPNPNLGGNLVKLSFLLPIVNLLPLSGEATIQTDAIVTTQRTAGNIKTPLLGQIQTYNTLVLNGTARLVSS